MGWYSDTQPQGRTLFPVHTILHPTDFSAYSDHAFRLACALARDYSARVVVLHVAEPPVVIHGRGVLPSEPKTNLDQLRKQLQQLVVLDSRVPVEHRLVEGDIVAEILRVAEESRCDLIMMGTHGRRGLGRLLLGSVAEQVMRRASCPVLTVKTLQAQAPAPPSEVPGLTMPRKGVETVK